METIVAAFCPGLVFNVTSDAEDLERLITSQGLKTTCEYNI
jgi:hypothetical protein